MEKEIDQAFLKVELLFSSYGLISEDWQKMRDESPSIMATIDKIEFEEIKGDTSKDDLAVLLYRWISNYELAIKRRSEAKKPHYYFQELF